MTLTCKVLAIAACAVGIFLGESGALGAPPSREDGNRSAQRGENAHPQARQRMRAKLRKFARHHRHHHHHARAHHRHHHHLATGGGGTQQTPKAN